MEIQEAIAYLKKYIKSDLFYEQEHYNRVEIVLNYIDKLQADKNKLINYIAIRENKTHEEVEEEFELGE